MAARVDPHGLILLVGGRHASRPLRCHPKPACCTQLTVQSSPVHFCRQHLGTVSVPPTVTLPEGITSPPVVSRRSARAACRGLTRLTTTTANHCYSIRTAPPPPRPRHHHRPSPPFPLLATKITRILWHTPLDWLKPSCAQMARIATCALPRSLGTTPPMLCSTLRVLSSLLESFSNPEPPPLLRVPGERCRLPRPWIHLRISKKPAA